jgi:hypothetical protein
MTAAATTTTTESLANSGASPAGAWAEMRDDSDLQFAPINIPEITPPEPGWFETMLNTVFGWLAAWLAPLGQMLGSAWWWLQWVLLGLVALFVLVLVVRMVREEAGKRRRGPNMAEADEWQPDATASLALLEDADRLAAEGRFDAATRLLLQRSVGQIAAARPGLVEPSSTARELAVLPALPAAARAAFAVIAERVERSLFALRALDRADWDAARAAYAEFALARLNAAVRT